MSRDDMMIKMVTKTLTRCGATSAPASAGCPRCFRAPAVLRVRPERMQKHRLPFVPPLLCLLSLLPPWPPPSSCTSTCSAAVWPFGRETISLLSKEEFMATHAHLVQVRGRGGTGVVQGRYLQMCRGWEECSQGQLLQRAGIAQAPLCGGACARSSPCQALPTVSVPAGRPPAALVPSKPAALERCTCFATSSHHRSPRVPVTGAGGGGSRLRPGPAWPPGGSPEASPHCACCAPLAA